MSIFSSSNYSADARMAKAEFLAATGGVASTLTNPNIRGIGYGVKVTSGAAIAQPESPSLPGTTVAIPLPPPKMLPPLPPKPPDDRLVPGSMVFAPPAGEVNLKDFSSWWKWTPGACWKHPEGPNSTVRPGVGK